MTMECNKEEAIRAKDIAENRMRAKDFVGARKIVIKAQQLFPDLENISQMLTVCDVHCCAEIKVNGETDWYGILQVEHTADETTIKKQYRKLALLLHPDKNKFEGAEAAFKLVGEANRTLSDQTRRSLHDIKRRTVFRTVQARQPPQQPRPSAARKQPGAPINATSSTRFNTPAQPPPAQNPNAPTFWTMCPFCGIRYQYYQEILNKALRCQSCKKPFIAYDLNVVPSRANPSNPWTRTGNLPQETRSPGAHAAGQKSHFANAAPGNGFQANVGVGSTSSNPLPKSGPSTGFPAANRDFDDNAKTSDKVKPEKTRSQERSKREKEVKPTAGNSRQKRARKMVVESESSADDSDSSDSDVVIEESIRPSGQSAGTAGSTPRRSSRLKQNISYNEDGDADSLPPQHKRLRKSGKTYDGDKTDQANSEGPCNGVDNQPSVEKKGSPNGLQEDHGTGEGEADMNTASSSKHSPRVDSAQKTTEDVEALSYPDPEFFDFEKNRDGSEFRVDQIWALYDDLDGMPRFYARIKNVYTPDFKVTYTWLEHDPIDDAEKEWSEVELPVGCGKFKLGKTASSKDKPIFSHLMSCKSGKKGSFEVYPRKGEVWALLKDWDIGWRSDADNHRIFEYEVVEVLSDFKEGIGATVSSLVKVNGFVCLFMRAVDGVHEISSSELLRFSHKVPSYQLTGKERANIPPGSFELDATSLPISFAESFPSVEVGTTKTDVPQSNVNVQHVNVQQKSSPNVPNGSCKVDIDPENVASKQKNDDQESTPHDVADSDDNASPVDSRNDFAYPDPEFCNFSDIRSKDKFEPGQIWALYSDIASFPNYYGMITKIESGENFGVHVTWLEACAVTKEEKRWADDLSVSCGTFKIGSEEVTYDSAEPFSHMVKAEALDKSGFFAIYPKTGEVWALYKNWNKKWTRSTVEDCEYELVEILSRGSNGVKCEYLAKVGGHRSVFMPERHSTVEIPATEYLRFSHLVPAFRLTEERGGKLRDFWELDPASMPQILLIVEDD